MAYDSAATRARILDAATAEFARYGIGGARIDRIAAAAPANKASIYAYFGNKDALFAAVLHRTLTGLAEAVEVDPERVPDYVGELFDYQLAHPELLRLVQQEAMAFAPADVGELAGRTAHYDDKVAGVRRAQKAGAVDPSLDPRHVVLALIGMVSWFTAAPQISQMIVGDLEKKAVVRRHRAALVDYARRIVTRRRAQVYGDVMDQQPQDRGFVVNSVWEQLRAEERADQLARVVQDAERDTRVAELLESSSHPGPQA